MNIRTLPKVVAAAFLFATTAFAQQPGTVTNHAFVIGKGAGQTGFTSLLCGSAQLAVGQSAADPICRTITGDVTINAAGATAIGAGKVTSTMLNADVFSTAHTWAGQQSFVAPVLGTPASGTLTNATGLPISTGVSGLGTGVATLLATPSSANLRAALTDESGTGAAVFADSPALTGTPTAPTAPPSDNSTKIATTAYVDAQVAGGVAGVASLDGQTGVLQRHSQPQGRLTITTATPVLTSTTTGQTTVYYTPYKGDMVPIYNGTNMTMLPFTELSQATTDTTKSPAAAASNSNYDIFVWNDSGTLRATRGPAWTNDTTRSAGTALVMVKGILLNNASITNGPAASRGTYVGTIRTNGSAAVDWQFGAFGAGWTPGIFGVWNAYNRVQVTTQTGDTTNTWSHNVADTWRAANGNVTARVSVVRGLNEDGITAVYVGLGQAAGGQVVLTGIGLNSTTSFAGTNAYSTQSTFVIPLTANFSGLMGLGYNYVSANEYQNTTGASTWIGDSGLAYVQSGMTVNLVQ